jgi:hypothetical protein
MAAGASGTLTINAFVVSGCNVDNASLHFAKHETDESKGNKHETAGSKGNKRETDESKGNKHETAGSKGNKREADESNGSKYEIAESNGSKYEIAGSNGNKYEIAGSNGNKYEIAGSNGNKREADESNGNNRASGNVADSQYSIPLSVTCKNSTPYGNYSTSLATPRALKNSYAGTDINQTSRVAVTISY